MRIRRKRDAKILAALRERIGLSGLTLEQIRKQSGETLGNVRHSMSVMLQLRAITNAVNSDMSSRAIYSITQTGMDALCDWEIKRKKDERASEEEARQTYTVQLTGRAWEKILNTLSFDVVGYIYTDIENQLRTQRTAGLDDTHPVNIEFDIELDSKRIMEQLYGSIMDQAARDEAVERIIALVNVAYDKGVEDCEEGSV